MHSMSDPNQCLDDAPWVANFADLPQWGGLGTFYSIAAAIIDSTQNSLSLSSANDLYQYLSWNHEDSNAITTSAVMNNANSQAGALAMEGISVVLFLVTFVFALGITCWRCCCCCSRNKKTNRIIITSKWALAVQLFFYLVSFGFVLAMAIVYGISVANIQQAAQNKIYITGSEDVNSKANKKQLECVFEQNIVQPYSFVETAIAAEPAINVAIWSDQSGTGYLGTIDETSMKIDLSLSINQYLTPLLYQLSDLMNDYNLMNDAACGAQISETNNLVKNLFDTTTALYNSMDNVTQQTNVTLSNAALTGRIAQQILSGSLSTLSFTINSARKNLHKMSKSLVNTVEVSNNWSKQLNTKYVQGARNAYEWQGFTPVLDGTQAAIAIPAAVILFFLLIGIIATIGFIVRPRLIESQQKTHTSVAGKFMMIGFYFCVYTTWVVILVTGSLYWFANPFSNTCYNLYDPNGSSDFYGIEPNPQVNGTYFNGSVVSSDYGDFIFELYNSRTIFETMGRLHYLDKPLMTTQEVMSFIDEGYDFADSADTIQLMDLQTSFDQTTFNHFRYPAASLQELTNTYDNDNNTGFLNQCLYSSKASMVAESLYQYTRSLDNLNESIQQLSLTLAKVNSNNQNNTKALMTVQLQQFVSDSLESLNQATSAYQSNLSSNVANARAIYNLYYQSFASLCNYYRGPLNGTWAAAGLMSFFMIPVAFLLLLTANRLRGNSKASLVDTATQYENNQREFNVVTADVPQAHPQPSTVVTQTVVEVQKVPAIYPALVTAYQYE